MLIGLAVMLRHSNYHFLWQIKYPKKTTAAFIDSLPNSRQSLQSNIYSHPDHQICVVVSVTFYWAVFLPSFLPNLCVL